MTTHAIDTNTLLDAFLARDDSVEIQSLLKLAEAGKCRIWIPIVVFFELAWVLSSFYHKDKKYVLDLLDNLLSMDNIDTEHKPALVYALTIFQKHASINLSDAYILASVLAQEPKQFISKDKKLMTLYLRLQKTAN